MKKKLKRELEGKWNWKWEKELIRKKEVQKGFVREGKTKKVKNRERGGEREREQERE